MKPKKRNNRGPHKSGERPSTEEGTHSRYTGKKGRMNRFHMNNGRNDSQEKRADSLEKPQNSSRNNDLIKNRLTDESKRSNGSVLRKSSSKGMLGPQAAS